MSVFQRICLFRIDGNRKAEACARSARSFLVSKGITVLTAEEAREGIPPELIITFGGDGTLLSGAKLAIRSDIPLMGINLGTVGFLTEEEPGNLIPALQQILEGRYTVEERSLMEAEHTRTGKKSIAMNDVVVSRGGFARLIRLECKVNEETFGMFAADGLIVATPTGSTGYSLSAGGPIVAPQMSCMIITPVCPHSLQHCSSVIPGNAVVRLILQPGRNQSAELQIDGQSAGALQSGDEIVVRGTDRKIRLLRLHSYQFFTLIRTKLNEWGTSHE